MIKTHVKFVCRSETFRRTFASARNSTVFHPNGNFPVV
jgi:hypothetical protein